MNYDFLETYNLAFSFLVYSIMKLYRELINNIINPTEHVNDRKNLRK